MDVMFGSVCEVGIKEEKEFLEAWVCALVKDSASQIYGVLWPMPCVCITSAFQTCFRARVYEIINDQSKSSATWQPHSPVHLRSTIPRISDAPKGGIQWLFNQELLKTTYGFDAYVLLLITYLNGFQSSQKMNKTASKYSVRFPGSCHCGSGLF